MISDFRSLGAFVREGLAERKADPNLMNMWATVDNIRSFLGHSVLEFLIDSNQKEMNKAERKHKHFVEIVNGSSVLPNTIFKNLQKSKNFYYILGAEVVKIIDNNTTVSVKVKDKESRTERQVSGDYAIVSTSARAVSLMAFEPSLPFMKRQAIDDVEFFGSVKIFLKFKTPFWATKNKLPIIKYGNMSTVNGGSASSDDILRMVRTSFEYKVVK